MDWQILLRGSQLRLEANMTVIGQRRRSVMGISVRRRVYPIIMRALE